MGNTINKPPRSTRSPSPTRRPESGPPTVSKEERYDKLRAKRDHAREKLELLASRVDNFSRRSNGLSFEDRQAVSKLLPRLKEAKETEKSLSKQTADAWAKVDSLVLSHLKETANLASEDVASAKRSLENHETSRDYYRGMGGQGKRKSDKKADLKRAEKVERLAREALVSFQRKTALR